MIGWLAQENKDRFGAALYDGKETWTFKPQQNRAHLLAVLKKFRNRAQSFAQRGKAAKADDGLTRPLQLMTKMIKSQGGGVCDQ